VASRLAVAVGAALSYADRRSRKMMWILKRSDGFELDSEAVNRIELDSNPVGSLGIQVRIQLAVSEPGSKVRVVF
jgi:hypothetical protein